MDAVQGFYANRPTGGKAMRVAAVGGALFLALPLSFALRGYPPALAIALVASGTALVLAACLFADSD
jgi:hypothetical protein